MLLCDPSLRNRGCKITVLKSATRAAQRYFRSGPEHTLRFRTPDGAVGLRDRRSGDIRVEHRPGSGRDTRREGRCREPESRNSASRHVH
jgi:hypothetical protein